MDFGIFISAFNHTYDKMKNERKMNPKEPSLHHKSTFCRELLCQIAKNENDVLFCKGNANGNPRTLKTFESYYRKHKRRSLHPIAVRIAYQPDRKKFKQFLQCIVDQCGGEGLLLRNFQIISHNTTAKSLLDDITREFVEILTNATAEQNDDSSSLQDKSALSQKESATSQDESASLHDESASLQEKSTLSHEKSTTLQEEPAPPHDESAQSQEGPHIFQSDLGRIRQIIRELCVLLEAMYELWPIFNSEQFMEQLKDPSSTEPKVCEFNDMFKQFSKLDKEMLFFCRKYKHIKQFEPVKLLANTLDKYCFKSGFTRGVDSNGSPGIFVYQNPGLQEYSDALVELDRSLDNLS